MSIFKITGGRKLNGEITPQGSKNEAFQIIAASIILNKLKIENCPKILDVVNCLAILEEAGAIIKWETKTNNNLGSDTLYIDNDNLREEYFYSKEYFNKCKKTRGSLIYMGALINRYGYAYIPKSGGDKIGKRPIDTHINGFISLGCDIVNDNIGEKIVLDKNKLSNIKHILLDEPSVTGSANVLLLALSGQCDIIIENFACEPYIYNLCTLFKSNGLAISGYGSNIIHINNTDNFYKLISSQMLGQFIETRLDPDFVEIGSWIALAVATRSRIKINHINIYKQGMTLRSFEKIGCQFEIERIENTDNINLIILEKNEYKISQTKKGDILEIYTQPWPFLSPDVLSLLIVACIRCNGSVLIHEKMFESRLYFVDNLINAGANIVLCDPHRAVIIGKPDFAFHPISSKAPDIRAGMALIIMALISDGESKIDNIEEFERGYENMEQKLRQLGANIERI